MYLLLTATISSKMNERFTRNDGRKHRDPKSDSREEWKSEGSFLADNYALEELPSFSHDRASVGRFLCELTASLAV